MNRIVRAFILTSIISQLFVKCLTRIGSEFHHDVPANLNHVLVAEIPGTSA